MRTHTSTAQNVARKNSNYFGEMSQGSSRPVETNTDAIFIHIQIHHEAFWRTRRYGRLWPGRRMINPKAIPVSPAIANGLPWSYCMAAVEMNNLGLNLALTIGLLRGTGRFDLRGPQSTNEDAKHLLSSAREAHDPAVDVASGQRDYDAAQSKRARDCEEHPQQQVRLLG